MKKIPNEVLDFFKFDIETYKGHVRFLGKYDAKDAYTYEYEEEVIIGLPRVCLYEKTCPLEIVLQFDALSVISKLNKYHE